MAERQTDRKACSSSSLIDGCVPALYCLSTADKMFWVWEYCCCLWYDESLLLRCCMYHKSYPSFSYPCPACVRFLRTHDDGWWSECPARSRNAMRCNAPGVADCSSGIVLDSGKRWMSGVCFESFLFRLLGRTVSGTAASRDGLGCVGEDRE